MLTKLQDAQALLSDRMDDTVREVEKVTDKVEELEEVAQEWRLQGANKVVTTTSIAASSKPKSSNKFASASDKKPKEVYKKSEIVKSSPRQRKRVLSKREVKRASLGSDNDDLFEVDVL